jgi:hypothetical protein
MAAKRRRADTDDDRGQGTTARKGGSRADGGPARKAGGGAGPAQPRDALARPGRTARKTGRGRGR